MRHGNITGKHYGRLVAIEKVDNDRNNHKRWLCKCECGNEATVLENDLVTGKTRSCGCYYKETRKTVSKTHGGSKTRLFHIWSSMRNRCENPSHKDYGYYGGRGITVCDEWNEYEAFSKWAYENGYADNLSIDRIDVNKGYSPDNCRWADAITQANNTRRNRMITYNGETKSLAMWARQYDLPQKLVRRRLEDGWTIEKALITPQRNVIV